MFHKFISFVIFLEIVLLTYTHSSAAVSFDLFPAHNSVLNVSNTEFRHYIYTGTQNQKTYTRGNFGLEVPFVTANINTHQYTTGIAAAAHLVMIPKNLKFPVDNFYAVLAYYFEGKETDFLSWRFYPVYHLSAHQADGHTGGIFKDSVHAVSSEMVKLELITHPIKNLDVSFGYGKYYHVCYQKGLKDRADINIMYSLKNKSVITPFLLVQNGFIHMKEWEYSFDSALGFNITNKSNRGIGIDFRYFDRVNPGYDFNHREQGVGVELNFYP